MTLETESNTEVSASKPHGSCASSDVPPGEPDMASDAQARVSLLGVVERLPIAAVALLFATYRRGGNSVIRQHDVLDAYVPVFSQLTIGDLFAPPGRELDYLLGGIPREFVGSEFHLGNILFVLLPVMWSILVNEAVMRFLAFYGMRTLLRTVGLQNRFIIFGIATLFSLQPFYLPAFGAVAGVPLLIAAMVWIHDTGRVGRAPALVLGLFPLYSSFAFNVPYGLALLLIIAGARLVSPSSPTPAMLRGFAIFTVSSVVVGWRFLLLVFVGPASHRSEMVVRREWTSLFRSGVADDFVRESQHIAYGKTVVVGFVLLGGLILLVGHDRLLGRRLRMVGVLAVAGVVAGVVIGRLWPIVEGNVVAMVLEDWGRVQMSRVRWFEPTLVYLLVALSMSAAVEFASSLHRRASTLALGGAWVLVVLLQSVALVNMHTFRSNPDSVSVREYYAEGTFSEVRSVIEADDGDLTVSVGLHPSVAMFNGIRVADGYWNGYPLDYKAEFRKLIAPSLDGDNANRPYFDNWGSRVYVFQQALPRPGCCGPTTRGDIELIVDPEQFDALRISHVVSTSRIINASDVRLELALTVGSDDELGEIFLYRVT